MATKKRAFSPHACHSLFLILLFPLLGEVEKLVQKLVPIVSSKMKGRKGMHSMARWMKPLGQMTTILFCLETYGHFVEKASADLDENQSLYRLHPLPTCSTMLYHDPKR